MARYAIACHAGALTRPGPAAKMLLHADSQEPPPAAFTGTTMALTGIYRHLWLRSPTPPWFTASYSTFQRSP
jgi:hypothetical protein